MTSPFSKDWKPSPESEAAMKSISRDKRVSDRNSAKRALKLASADPAVVAQASGTIPGMGLGLAAIRKRVEKGLKT